LRGLERLSAPPELEERVRRSLAGPRRFIVIPMHRRLVTIAATLIVVLGAAAVAWNAGARRAKPYEFAVVRVSSVNQLDSFAQSFFSVVSGGIPDLPGEAR
jgi:hypothetical protein